MRALILTALAMLAFAGNSLLCRAALRDAAIDPATFTAIRLASGSIVLLAILMLRDGGLPRSGGGNRQNWQSSFALFVYAAAFSFAYVSLSAGAGALLLFGFVQATMIGYAWWDGERPDTAEWTGWLLAAGGLLALLLPGAGAPPWRGAVLMAAAGIAWGGYSLLGRGRSDPLAATAGNFLRTTAFLPLLALAGFEHFSLSAAGAALAVASGALTSGLGYVLWYAAVRRLSSLHAALVQLSVPAIAAAGGVLLLGEAASVRLVAGAALVIGGICLALTRRRS